MTEIQSSLQTSSSLNLKVNQNDEEENIWKFLNYMNQLPHDITVICGDAQQISTNKLTLAVLSPMLRQIFSEPISSPSVVSLPDFPMSTLEHFLDIITKGCTASTNATQRDIVDIIDIAKVFSVDISSIHKERKRGIDKDNFVANPIKNEIEPHNHNEDTQGNDYLSVKTECLDIPVEAFVEAKSTSKKRTYTAKYKLEIITAAECSSNREAARQFCISESMVRLWRKKKEIFQQQDRAKSGNRVRAFGGGRKPINEHFEHLIFNWIVSEREMARKVTRQQLRTEASRIAKQLDLAKFAASDGWCSNFLRRKGLFYIGPGELSWTVAEGIHLGNFGSNDMDLGNFGESHMDLGGNDMEIRKFGGNDMDLGTFGGNGGENYVKKVNFDNLNDSDGDHMDLCKFGGNNASSMEKVNSDILNDMSGKLKTDL